MKSRAEVGERSKSCFRVGPSLLFSPLLSHISIISRQARKEGTYSLSCAFPLSKTAEFPFITSGCAIGSAMESHEGAIHEAWNARSS
jgi:hypothetical protein